MIANAPDRHLNVRPRHKTLLRIAGVLALAAAVSGCAHVVETSVARFAPESPGEALIGCRTTLGGYFLPKTFLNVKVAKVGAAGTRPEYVLHHLAPIVKPDNRHGFCLDYLASPFSSDQVIVRRAKSGVGTQLLQVVASNAYDQTSFIIRRLIRAAFTMLANRSTRALGASEVFEPLADVEFDPFDVRQTAVINDRLRKYGFCLVLENYSFNPALGSVERYCRNPLEFARRDTAFARLYAAYEAEGIKPNQAGILYRPRAVYQVRIYAKDDPDGGGPWRLRKTEMVPFENISPVLSLRVDRTVFAKRKTALLFDDGALTSVCIYKSSELEAAVEIPLELVKAVVALPAEILKVQYDQVADSNNLLDAEKKLLAAQNKYLAVLHAKDTGATIPNATTVGATTLTAIGDTPFELPAIGELEKCPTPAVEPKTTPSTPKPAG